MIFDVNFPNKVILEIAFLNNDAFYYLTFQHTHYYVVGGDKEIESNLIGIKDNGEVYYLTLDDDIACYIACDIETFIKELLLFDDYMTNIHGQLPDNPSEHQLRNYANIFRNEILKLDNSAFRDTNTYWSEICEELEYGICL